MTPCTTEPSGTDSASIRIWPLRALPDGRLPQITSGFRNPLRRDHQGVDLMYAYQKSDPKVRAGDGGAVVRAGVRRWWVPEGTACYAMEPGEVIRVGQIGSGWRLWIWHPYTGISTGYFHLRLILPDVSQVGARVGNGQALGLVGDNPKAFDPVHLHLEAIQGRHFPDPLPRIDPAEFLKAAKVVEGS